MDFRKTWILRGKTQRNSLTLISEVSQESNSIWSDIVAEAKRKGYVTTLMNRRRYLPEITSSNFNLRSFAERTAMNTPIQGSAADIIKKAMIEMAKRLEVEGMQTRMLLQVHDELIFEAPEDEIEKLKEIVPEVMESALALDVPLKVDWAFGKSWYDTK